MRKTLKHSSTKDAKEERRRLFNQKKRFQPHRCLILVMGVAGSGKTTVAKEILRHLWAVYLDNNHIVDAFFPDTRNGKAYERLRPRFYTALYKIVEQNLVVGNAVVLDVPNVKEIQIPRWRRFIKQLAARTKSKIVCIRCFCSESVLYSRIRSRGEKRDRWKLKHWEAFLREQPIRVPVPFPHLEIDTEKNFSANADKAIRYILQSSKIAENDGG